MVMVARLEQLTRQLYTRLLVTRDKSWARLRQDSVERLEELADVFGGKQKLSRQYNINYSKNSLESRQMLFMGVMLRASASLLLLMQTFKHKTVH